MASPVNDYDARALLLALEALVGDLSDEYDDLLMSSLSPSVAPYLFDVSPETCELLISCWPRPLFRERHTRRAIRAH